MLDLLACLLIHLFAVLCERECAPSIYRFFVEPNLLCKAAFYFLLCGELCGGLLSSGLVS